MRGPEGPAAGAVGRVAVVTGGGVGLGRAISVGLAAAGARAVVINYAHSAKEAEQTLGEVKEHGCEGLVAAADVADDGAARGLIDTAVEAFGGVDVLVNNAGVSRRIPLPDLEALTDDIWDEILGVNLMGAFHCSRAAAPQLRERRGAIVNIASMSGHRGIGASMPYAVSKAAVLQLTRNLAMALAPEVTVNSITPGAVSTRLFRSIWNGEEELKQAEESFAETTPLGRIGSAEDIAEAVLALLGTGFVTGQDLMVDGGRYLNY